MTFASEKVYRINTLPLDGNHPNPYRTTFNRIVREWRRCTIEGPNKYGKQFHKFRWHWRVVLSGVTSSSFAFFLRSCQWQSRAKCDERQERGENRGQIAWAEQMQVEWSCSHTAVDGRRGSGSSAKTLAREERAKQCKNLCRARWLLYANIVWQ